MLEQKFPEDQAVRDACIAVHKSFVVTAPAGSGKTSLLTQRTLALLATVENPEAIVCITFTRKAAAEMRQRIISALEHCSANACPEDANGGKTWQLARAALEQDQRFNWQLLNNPARLKITTIDGFCRSITNQLPMAAGVGVGLGNLDLPEQAYRQAARDTLQWLEKPPSVYHKALKQLLLSLDGNTQRLEDLFYLLLQKRDQWLPLVVSSRDRRELLEDNINQLICDELTVCRNLCLPFAGDLIRLANYCGNNLRQAGSDSAIAELASLDDLPPNEAQALNSWRAVAELLLTATGSYRKKFDKKTGLPAGKTKAEKDAVEPYKILANEVLQAAHACEGLESQLALIKRLPPNHYPDNAWQFLEHLTLLLPLLVGHLKTHFAQISAVDFTEISQAAVSALDPEDISEILLRLNHQIRHILVDEFQDTSQIQLDLLTRLTAGWQPGDGRTLFLVGDGMQSCYGFRGADVGLFLEVKANGIGDIKPDARALTTNFRSDAGVVDWVNNAFNIAFPAEDDIARGAVTYNHAVAFKDADSAAHYIAPVHCYGLVQNQDEAGSRNSEAQIVVDIVKQTRAKSPNDSIAILVRGRGHLNDINAALSEAGLIPQATDIEPLAKRQAIIDLLSLTKALLRPSDSLAWFAILRSPWAALSPEELLIVSESFQAKIPRYPLFIDWLINADFAAQPLQPTTRLRLTQLQNVFTIAWQQRRRHRLRVWVERVWAALNGAGGLTFASDLNNIQAFWQLLENYDDGGYLTDWQGFHLAMDKLYAAPAAGADGNLHVMTMHKSKGLEFDHVIIPALDKGSRADDKELLYWQNRLDHQGNSVLLMAPIDTNTDKKAPSLYRFLDEEQKIKNRYEAVRLLYVGCTRAIKQLHLLAQLNWDDKNDQPKEPTANTLVASIWPIFREQMQVLHPSVDIDNRKTPGTAPADWHKIRQTQLRDMAIPEHDAILADYRGQEYHDEDNTPDLAPYKNKVARAFGTALHQLLEIMAQQGIEHWQADALDDYRAAVAAWLQQAGAFETKQLSRDIVRIAQQLLQSSNARWLLSSQRQDAACELELIDAINDKLYIVDRTFIDDGKRWIIDYKTSQPFAEESLEAFFQREAAHYQPQLSKYANLFQTMEPATPVVTALYFPLIDQLHTVATDTCDN